MEYCPAWMVQNQIWWISELGTIGEVKYAVPTSFVFTEFVLHICSSG